MWTHYIESAKNMLRFSIGECTIRGGGDPVKRSYNRRTAEALRGVLPYCIHPVESGEHSEMIWLNRDYKPLGILMPFHSFDYKDFPYLHINLDDPAIQNLLPRCQRHQLFGGPQHAYYLYDDASSPTRNKACAKRLLDIIQMIDKPEAMKKDL